MEKKNKSEKTSILQTKNLEINEEFIDNFFSDNDYLHSFIYKKTKRITAGLFLVTNPISSQENIKDILRKKGLLFLENIINIVSGSKNDSKLKEVDSSLLEIVSLLEIAYFSGVVSDMNFNVMKNAYENLGDLIKLRKSELGSSVLINKDFFDIFENKEGLKDISKGQKDKGEMKMSFRKDVKDNKGQQKDKNKKISKSSQTEDENIKKEPQNKGQNQSTFSERKALILDFVRKNEPVTIKDISFIISDCSRKTVQRDMLSMVQDGFLRREGKKRWSIYTIKK